MRFRHKALCVCVCVCVCVRECVCVCVRGVSVCISVYNLVHTQEGGKSVRGIFLLSAYPFRTGYVTESLA